MVDSVAVFPPSFRILDTGGNPASGAKVKFWQGGTSTPLNVFSDKDLSSSLGPIVYTRSDGFLVASQGIDTTVSVFTGTALFDIEVTDANDVVIYPRKINQKGALDTSTFLTSGATSTLSIPAVQTALAAVTLDSTFRGKILSGNTTANSITLTLQNAATLGDGWNVEIRKRASQNTLTIQTTGGEFINESLTSLILPNKDDFIAIRCNGTGFVIGASKISQIEPYARNLSLLVTAGSNALTIALKTQAGLDPTADNPVRIPFRNVTPGSGDFTAIDITAAMSLVVSAGSTLGTSNSVACKLWLVAFNDGGTVRVGIVNCLSSLNIYPLGQIPIASSSAEGGAGGADSAQVFYTGAAVTSKAYTILGYISFESGLSTAGNWSVTPTRVQLHGPNVPLPGTNVQRARTQTGAVATGSTVIPFDDTNPQISEGDEYMSLAFVATSAAHIWDISALMMLANTASQRPTTGLFRDAVADALAVVLSSNNQPNIPLAIPLAHRLMGLASATMRLRAGASSGTNTLNGEAGVRKYGGFLASYLQIDEITT